MENYYYYYYLSTFILDGFEIDGNGSSKSVSEIEYNFFLMCYAEYNQGKDSFPDQVRTHHMFLRILNFAFVIVFGGKMAFITSPPIFIVSKFQYFFPI